MATDKKDMKSGVVYLIGAGPGDPELITVKGKRLLHECDVVVYDNLIPDELVAMLPDTIEKQYVGKKAGHHALKQDEINILLVKLAFEGKTVARLKGGDPAVFGCGSVEALHLKQNNIKFEFVPGITAGVAAPAYGGIPCTDRNAASFVVFVTGHEAANKETSSIPWDWIAKAHQGTVVVYMGVGELESIVTRLISDGMPPDIPAAVIERGTFPSQRVVTSPLDQLPKKAELKGIKPPAITVIGNVVNFHTWMDWYDRIPLLGASVMVTRAANQAQEMYNALRKIGAEVLPYPTIATTADDDPIAWEQLERITGEKNWLVFTSENGVRYFIKQYVDRHGDIRKLSDYRIAAIGEGTSRTLQSYHLTPELIPDVATVATLAQELSQKLKTDRHTVIRLRGNLADDTIETAVQDAGAEVLPLTVYRIYHPTWPDGMKEKLLDRPPRVITFTSSSTVTGFFENLTNDEARRVTANALIASIGPSTTRTAQSRGLKVTIEAEQHTIAALIDSVVCYFKDNPEG